MNGVTNGVGSVASTEIGAERFPVFDTVLGNDFESGRDVALEELGGFSIVLLLNLHEAGRGCAGEFSHAQLRDDKSVLIEGVQDLSGVHVHVGLNEGERALLI